MTLSVVAALGKLIVAARTKAKRKPARSAALKSYAEKRDFSRTAEPRPEPKPKPKPRAAAGAALQFVVQKHAARRLHFDLRLELDGTLKSWAVTRGPSLVTTDKRLAVRTEDHPMQYLEFEGNIPKGEYGGGSMIVWDRGAWAPVGDPQRGLTKGHLEFVLDGTRLKGRWHLVRMRPRRGEKKEQWLLIKADDEFARPPGSPEIAEEETTSFVSGLTNTELAAQGELRADHAAREAVVKARKVKLPDVGEVGGAQKKLLPAFVEPSLAAFTERPPSGPRWVHEIKYDGYRTQARIDGGKIQLLTRKGLDWTARFKSIATALKKLPLGSAWLDGEIVVEDDGGISSFNALQADLAASRQDRLIYHVFDLLYCEGFDLTKATLLDRKSLLQKIIDLLPQGSAVRYSEHLQEDGPRMLEHSCRLGLEGIVSKRIDCPYRGGRGEHWLKSKCMLRQEFIIVGYLPSTAASAAVGSLVLGYYEGGKLMYAGRVGTGYSAAQARSLREALEQIVAKKPAFGNAVPPPAEKGVRWVEPRLVCDVEYRGLTEDRLVRQAAFKGLREDKPPEEVVLETSGRVAKGAGKGAEKRAEKGAATRDTGGVRLTHPERILWEGPGVTKQGLADFYTEIADWILPHITNRVLSLLRCPSGVSGQCFFAKHPWHGLAAGTRRIDVGETEPMLAIDDLAGLLGLVQAGVVEIHPWGSTTDHLEQPDQLIFDLDPAEDVPWSAVIEAAHDVRARLEGEGLKSFVKTSGGKGLHVVVPLEPNVDWDIAKAFTQKIAAEMAKSAPDRYLATMSKKARRGRIFVDYLRNSRGQTAVAAYSTRAFPNATVSTPLDWSELSEGIRADHFKIDNLRQRLKFLSADPWRDFFTTRQRLPTGR
jgi:bifunctional non-homologous end joining protein LigD